MKENHCIWIYHEPFNLNGMLGMRVIVHNLSGELRNIMAGVALAGEIHIPAFVRREAVHPSY